MSSGLFTICPERPFVRSLLVFGTLIDKHEPSRETGSFLRLQNRLSSPKLGIECKSLETSQIELG